MAKVTLDDIYRLPVADRILIVEDILDSIAAEQEMALLTDEECELIDSRLEEHHKNPGAGSPWEETMERIRKRVKQCG